MKIGVIGAGRIGRILGEEWAAAGHEVVFGTRNPDQYADHDLPGDMRSFAQAAQHGEAILFAIPGRAMIDTVKSLDLAGKIVMDATNGGDTPDQPLVRAIAETHAQAHVYKAFNTLGFENFQNPLFGDERADMLFIGPEFQQKVVSDLIADVGLNPVYIGDLDQTAALDAALSLWFALSRRFGRHLAFRILHDGD